MVIGFDVSKAELVGALVDAVGQKHTELVVANQLTKITKLLKALTKEHPGLRVAAEATGRYHQPLAKACLSLGVELLILNPITTKQYGRFTVRKSKTDRLDAVAIARVALQGEGYVADEDLFSPAKILLRLGLKLRQQAQRLLLQSQHIEATLESDPALEELQSLRAAFISRAEAIESRAMAYLNHETLELLQSLPGIGPLLAGRILSEVGKIKRFTNAKALVAFAGLDPRIKQSGKTSRRNTRLTKRGSPFLRRTLFMAATIAERCDPELKSYYEKKRNEGKPYTVATLAVARKLTHRIYAVLQRGTPYKKVLT